MAEVVFAVLVALHVFPFEVGAAAAGNWRVGVSFRFFFAVQGRGRVRVGGVTYRLPSFRTPATRSIVAC